MLAFKAVNRLETTIGSKRLGELFIELGYLNTANLNYALEYQTKRGGRLGKILITLGYISRLELYEGLAKHFSLPFETDTAYIRESLDIKTAIILTREEMLRYQAVPFQVDGKSMTILTAEPYSRPAAELIQQKAGVKKIDQIVVTDLEIKFLAEEIYGDNILDMSGRGLRRAAEKPTRQSFNKLIARENTTRNTTRYKPAIRILNVPDDVSELVIIKRGKKN